MIRGPLMKFRSKQPVPNRRPMRPPYWRPIKDNWERPVRRDEKLRADDEDARLLSILEARQVERALYPYERTSLKYLRARVALRGGLCPVCQRAARPINKALCSACGGSCK